MITNQPIRRLFSRAALTLALALALTTGVCAEAGAQGTTPVYLSLDKNDGWGEAATAIPVNYDYINGGYHYTLSATYYTRAGHSIICWSTSPIMEGTNYGPSATITMTESMTLYAIWDDLNTSFTLSPISLSSADFDANGYAPLIVTATNIDFATRPVPGSGDEETADHLHVEVSSGNLTNGTATLPFSLYNNGHNGPGTSMGANFDAGGSNELSICIDPVALAAAALGTYTCDLSYTSDWFYDGVRVAGPSGTIPLTLTVTAPAVTYLDADGHELTTTDYTILTGSETTLGAGTYLVASDITYTHGITLTGNVNLILKDGCTMNVGTSESRISGNGIDGFANGDKIFTIYGQALGTGTLNVYASGDAISVDAMTVNGGNITASTDGESDNCAIYSYGEFNINRGTVSATATGTQSSGIWAGNSLTVNGGTVEATHAGLRTENEDVAINGGNVNASSINAEGNITLGWNKPTDRISITASSYDGTVEVASGKKLYDGDGNFLNSGTVSDLSLINGKTLQPVLILNETDGVTPLTTWAGATAVPVEFTRSFTANVASTVCQPFEINPATCADDGTFYTFSSVDETTSPWTVTMEEANGVQPAGTPLLFMPSATGNVTISGTFATIADSYTAGTETQGDWTFTGTYDKRQWDDSHNSDEIGRVYGFAAQAGTSTDGQNTAIEAGKFFRVAGGPNSYIVPFRAYLKYTGTAHGNAPAYSTTRSASAIDELPAQMIVRLVGSNGETTSLSEELRVKSEEVATAAEWYDLSGRKLDGKPSQRGIYINNGKKVVVH